MTLQEYIKMLKEYRDILPKQCIKTLRGQAIHGDIKGAIKGLNRVIKNK